MKFLFYWAFKLTTIDWWLVGYVGRSNCSSDLIVIGIQIFYHLTEKEMFARQNQQPDQSIINVADKLAGFIIVLIDEAYDRMMVWWCDGVISQPINKYVNWKFLYILSEKHSVGLLEEIFLNNNYFSQ